MRRPLSNTSFEVEEDPEWLDSIRGENPLLGDSEFTFISQVRSEIVQAVDEWTPQETSSRNFDIQILDLTRNFMELIEHLRMNSHKTLFLRTYPEWRIHRANTVAKLRKIADSIDEDKENCETATMIGSGISLIGGLMSLFSGQNVQITGSALLGLGNLTTAGTSLIGSMLLKENINEAKEAIDKDRKHMVNLWKWIENTEHIRDIVNSIESMDIGGSLQATAKRLHSVSKMKLDSRGEQSKVREVVRSFKCPQELRSHIPDIMGILVSVLMLCDRFRPFIERARKGVEIGSRLRLSAKLLVSAVGLNNAMGASQAVELSSNQRALIIGGICADLAIIVQTYMERNSESVESRKIRRAIEILRDEGDLFRDLYDEIRGVNDAENRRIV